MPQLRAFSLFLALFLGVFTTYAMGNAALAENTAPSATEAVAGGEGATLFPAPPLEKTKVVHAGGFPEAISPQATSITKLYNFIFGIIAAIFAVVMVVLLVALWRFRASAQEKRGKKPATFHHSTALEIFWTAIPALITVALAYYSFTTMLDVRKMPENGLNVEVVAYQFGWDFYYPDFAETDAKTGEATHLPASEPTAPHAALSTTGTERFVKDLVVPVNVPVKLYVTASDVIHAFYTPAVGVKIDAVPGRVNMANFTPQKVGNFLGQCTELCGSAHGEMFYNLKVVPWADFVDYINARRTEAGLQVLTSDDVRSRLFVAKSS